MTGCIYIYIYMYVYVYICIHYYIPLPLNLANNKEATTSKQASTSLFRFGHCLASWLRALLYSNHPRAYVVASPNPCFEPKNSPVAPRVGGAKSGGAFSNLRILCPSTAFFGPKRRRNPVSTAERRQTPRTLHVRLDCSVTKSPLLTSNSTICLRSGPKMTTNGHECGLPV